MEKKRKGKVLVIEDNEGWSKRIRTILENNGFFVVTAKTKEEGLRILEKELFHFATIDLQLDEKTLLNENFEGWDVLRKILNLGLENTMPTMIITGFPGDEQTDNRFKAIKEFGATFFMKKSEWNNKKFLENVITSVDRHDMHFINDHRD